MLNVVGCFVMMVGLATLLMIGYMFLDVDDVEAGSWCRVSPNRECGEDHHANVPEEGGGSSSATYRG